MTCKFHLRRFWDMVGTYNLVSYLGFDKFATVIGKLSFNSDVIGNNKVVSNLWCRIRFNAVPNACTIDILTNILFDGPACLPACLDS